MLSEKRCRKTLWNGMLNLRCNLRKGQNNVGFVLKLISGSIKSKHFEDT